MRTEKIWFKSGETDLSGSLYIPDAIPETVAVLNGATGVPQGYYSAFASWLADARGIVCLTYDYRDFGASAQKPLRLSKATMSDWALEDQPAARHELRRRFPDARMWVIGHSLGGMLMPMQGDLSDIDRLITVASGRVNVRNHPWPYQGLARLFWFGHVPLVTRLLGYLPGRAVGLGADLPADLYWQWRRWCTHPDFYFGDQTMILPDPHWPESIPAELIALSDDPVCPRRAVDALAEIYGRGAKTRVLDPAAFGLKSIGHLAAFARRNAAVWPALLDGQEVRAT